MPADLRVSDFLFQFGQSLSGAGKMAEGFSDKFFEAERVAEINAGQVEIDRAYDQYARDYKKRLFGDPSQPFDPTALKPVVGDVSTYQKDRAAFVSQYVANIAKQYKNPEAQKALMAYANQKGVALEQYVDDRYTEYKINGLQALSLNTADEILKTYQDTAQAKSAIDAHFGSMVANGVYDELSAYKAKLGYYGQIFKKEQADVETFAGDLVTQIQNGFDIKEAEKAFSERLDAGIALGAFGAGDKATILKSFKDTSVTNAVAGKAVMALSGTDGYLTPDGLDKANKLIEKSSLTPVQKAEASGVLYNAYTKKLYAEQAAIKAFDQPMVESFQKILYQDVPALADPAKKLEMLTALSQSFNAKAPVVAPTKKTDLAALARGEEPTAGSVWAFKSQSTRNQMALELKNAMSDAMKEYTAATNDSGKAWGDSLRGRWAQVEVTGTPEDLEDFEMELRGLMAEGTFSGESLTKMETLLTDVVKKRADVTATGQDDSYATLKTKLALFDQAAGIYEVDKNWEALSSSYTDTVGFVLNAIGNTNLKPTQFSEILTEAMKKAGDYTKKIAAINKENRDKAVASFEQSTGSTVESLSDAINRIVDGKRPKGAELLQAIAALENLGPQLEGYYVKGDLDKSFLTDAGHDKLQGEIDSALKKGREYVASVDGAAAKATTDAKKDATNKDYWDLRSALGQKLTMDVGGVKAGTVVTQQVLELFVDKNWDLLDSPDSKRNSLLSVNSEYNTERDLLKGGLDKLLKDGKITEAEYAREMQSFEETLQGKGGRPTKDTVAQAVTSTLDKYKPGAPKPTAEIAGPGNTFSVDGVKLMYSAYNGGMAGAGFTAQRQSLALQTAKVLGGFLGFDEAGAKALYDSDAVGGTNIQVKTSSGTVAVADAPVIFKDNAYWAMVPSSYDAKTKKFSGELKLARVDPETKIATILDNQQPLAEIQKQRNLVKAKIDQVGQKLYDSRYSAAYKKDAFLNMAKDTELLHALGLKTGASQSQIFQAIYNRYAEYESAMENKAPSAGQSAKTWAKVKERFLTYINDPLDTSGTDITRRSVAELKYSLDTVMKNLRSSIMSDRNKLRDYDDDLKDRGIDPYKR